MYYENQIEAFYIPEEGDFHFHHYLHLIRLLVSTRELNLPYDFGLNPIHESLETTLHQHFHYMQ